MTNAEREQYLKAYYDNEADANKHMSFANAFAGIGMIAIWICYLTGLFEVKRQVLPLINIVFPISILILFTPLLYVYFFKKALRKKNYKLFVTFSFVLVIAALNVIIPKHAILGWALCIVMTNHYYNPKMGLTIYIIVMATMLLCLYGAMFVGEYDPNLLGNGIIEGDKIVYVEGAQNRYEMLHQMLLNGENRYLKVFVYYFLPRGFIISLVFFVSNALNRRTYKLLVSEIHVGSEQQKMKTELEVAKEIQINTLPTGVVANEDIEIQAELKAAKEVGGDFYDYYLLDDSHVALLIGDVSGKGIPAAMFMMKVITCFRNFVSVNLSPMQTLKEVNKVIHKGNDNSMFVTCFYAIINTKTGEMKYANAGHNKPIIGQNGSFRYLETQSGFILGAMEQAFVVDETYQLNNGDVITLYTDGITEARNKDGELFGEKRLLESYNKKEHSCLVELHHSIKDDIDKFVADEEQSDDMTYITLKFHGDKYRYDEKRVKGVKENIPVMLDFISEFAKKEKFDSAFINNLSVVADEMLSNIVKYAYKDYVDDMFVRILYNPDKKVFVLTIIDRGDEFNPFLVDNHELEGDVSNKKEGGLGILIVKKMMSEYAYDFINHKNIITLKKKF